MVHKTQMADMKGENIANMNKGKCMQVNIPIPFGASEIGFLLLYEKTIKFWRCPATVYHEDHCMTTQEVMFPKRPYQILTCLSCLEMQAAAHKPWMIYGSF